MRRVQISKVVYFSLAQDKVLITLTTMESLIYMRCDDWKKKLRQRFSTATNENYFDCKVKYIGTHDRKIAETQRF